MGQQDNAADSDGLGAIAAATPDAPAIIDPTSTPRVWSGSRATGVTRFAELDSAAHRLARALATGGASPGDPVVWCGPNTPEVLLILHAARRAGVVAVPLSYRFTKPEMHHVLEDSEAVTVVVDAEQAALIAELRPELPAVRDVLVYGGRVPEGMRSFDEALLVETDDPPDTPTPDLGATMTYTSGTTGKPKGAVRTKRDVALVAAMLEILGLGQPDDVHLTTGPLYHSGPLMLAMLSHSAGNPVVVTRHFDASAWLRLVAEHRVTNTFSAPTQLKRIVSVPDEELDGADLSSMRCLIANAAPVPYALKQQVIERLGDGFLFEIYGSTELGVATILRPEEQLAHRGSCGRPYGGIGLRTVGEDGEETQPGEPGELFIRTGLGMDGYHRTDEQLAAHGAEGEWRSVGDIATIDADGYVSILDRRTDLIITGGMNVYPAEVEAVLHEHPDVMDAAVIGVPDDEWGRRVHAVVEPRPGTSPGVDDLLVFAAERLAGYKRPRTLELVDALPRTESGKLLRRVLRDPPTPPTGDSAP